MENIIISEINREEAFRYLSAGNIVPDNDMNELADRCEKKLIGVIKPKYTYKIFPIEKISENKTFIGNISAEIKSRDLAELLEGCTHAVFMCATVGTDTDTLIRRLKVTDMASAVMTDAMASAAIEKVCAEFDELLAKKHPDKYITFRFSPGYGDLDLSFQKTLLSVLDSRRQTGITLSPSLLMNPMKSVSGICGISDTPIAKKRSGCVCCNLKESCLYRKRGMRCGS